MQKRVLLLAGLLSAVASHAQPSGQAISSGDDQPHIAIQLKYNGDAKRYEVFARSSFNATRFALGPSQVSVVLPKELADQPLNILSETSLWRDNSRIYAPDVAPVSDFHGISSSGQALKLQRDEEVMLFSFALNEGYVDGVRLFMNEKDPHSAQLGMKGSDFANTLINAQSQEFYRPGFTAPTTELAVAKVPSTEDAEVTVYPNPITSDQFTVTAKRFTAGERIKIRLFTTTGVEVATFEDDAAKLVNRTVQLPRALVGQAYLSATRVAAPDSPELPNAQPTRQNNFVKKLLIVR